MKKRILIIIFITIPLLSCSIFDTKGLDGTTLVGRNFDYSKGNARVSFIPSNQNSYGVILFSFENFNMPYEGMNDKGLFVAISAVPYSKTTINILKPIRKSLEFVKIILQKSQSIDEVIKEFDKYSIVFGEFLGNPLIHFKIVDRFGKTVIVEFINNKMVILKNKKAKIMTNHYLSDSSIKPNNKTSYQRFNDIKNRSYTDVESLFKELNRVKQDDTLWSNVYDLTNQIVYVKYLDRDIVRFNLKDELYKSNRAFYYNLETLNREMLFIKPNSNILVRPHFGFGSDNSSHFGVRLLLNSSQNQVYGLELTKFKMNDNEFTAMGAVLEQRLWEWFNMSIGTVGYFDYGVNSQNIIGIVSNLGWEPNNHIPFKPFITFRNDTIFAKEETKNIYSISFGLKLEL